jgi:hypothetical protein
MVALLGFIRAVVQLELETMLESFESAMQEWNAGTSDAGNLYIDQIMKLGYTFKAVNCISEFSVHNGVKLAVANMKEHSLANQAVDKHVKQHIQHSNDIAEAELLAPSDFKLPGSSTMQGMTAMVAAEPMGQVLFLMFHAAKVRASVKQHDDVHAFGVNHGASLPKARHQKAVSVLLNIVSMMPEDSAQVSMMIMSPNMSDKAVARAYINLRSDMTSICLLFTYVQGIINKLQIATKVEAGWTVDYTIGNSMYNLKTLIDHARAESKVRPGFQTCFGDKGSNCASWLQVADTLYDRFVIVVSSNLLSIVSDCAEKVTKSCPTWGVYIKESGINLTSAKKGLIENPMTKDTCSNVKELSAKIKAA